MNRLNKTKLLSCLICMDKKELKRLLVYVQSPYFNTHKPTKKLMEFLYAQHAKWEDLTKREIFDFVFPNQANYQVFKVDNLLSYLMRLLEGYLAQKRFEENTSVDLYLLEPALLMGMDNLFQQKINKLEKALVTGSQDKLEAFAANYEFMQQQHFFQGNKEKKYKPELLIEAVRYLDLWYIWKKLEHSCEIMALSRLSNEKSPLPLFDEFIGLVEEYWDYFSKFPLINAHYKCLMTIIHPSEESYYFELRDYVYANEKAIGKKNLKELYKHILNYTIIKTNGGKPFFSKESFEVYKKLIDNDLVLNRNEIKQVTYTNIIALACIQEEFAWAKEFAQNFAKYLSENARKNAYNYNIANILFYEKEYKMALGHLREIVFSNIFYQANTRAIQVKIYYELKEMRLLESALESFRIFTIRNKKLPKKSSAGLRNFIKGVTQLIQIESVKSTYLKKEILEMIEVFQEDLESYKNAVLHKKWLQEKKDELLTYLD